MDKRPCKHVASVHYRQSLGQSAKIFGPRIGLNEQVLWLPAGKAINGVNAVSITLAGLISLALLRLIPESDFYGLMLFSNTMSASPLPTAA